MINPMRAGTPALCLLVFTCTLLACSEEPAHQALGTLERDRILLKATADEIILSEPVAEGEQVEAGTLLVQLDDRRQKANVARARAELAQAEARLEELRQGARVEDIAVAEARLNGAKATLTEAVKTYQRAVRLVDQKLASQAQLDRALAGRDSAEAAVEAATEELLILTNGTRQEELDQARAARDAAAAQVALEEHFLSELSITATRDGYLDSLPWNEGERVTAGTTIAVMLAGGRPFARVYVPEPWRARIAVGDQLEVHVDGIEQPLTGRLRWIATEPAFTPYYALNAEDRARLVYLAEVDLLDGDKLPTGVPAQVSLPRD